MTFCLTLIEQTGRIATSVFDQDEVSVGRSSSNDIRPDPVVYSQVSRNHGRIIRVGPGQFLYEDLRSTQGSYHEGREVRGRVPLQRDDVVVLGKDGPSMSITWPKARQTGQMGTHYKTMERPSAAFPLAFSENFLDVYRHYEKVGAGGFGEVWRAEPIAGGRAAAIKLLHPMLMTPDNLADEDRDSLIRRFSREARVTHDLSQSGAPGIVRVHSWGDDADKDFLYLIMDFIEGIAFDRLIRSQARLTWQQVVCYFRQIAQGLDAAHNFVFHDESGKTVRGVVHRDIKPGNLLLEPDKGLAWIVDFGVAGFVEGGERLTSSNISVGTHLYMPPEALLSQVVTESTDLWGFAVTLYLALSGGQFPFPAAEAAYSPNYLLPDDYVPIRHHHSTVPEELADALQRALSIDPAARLQSAREWADLLAYLEEAARLIP